MGNLLFKNAHVIDPSQKLDTVGDVLVVDGKIADFGKALSCSADNIIDASGLVLAPGLLIYMCICVIRVLNIKRI
mgnify:CR=1 FL=1